MNRLLERYLLHVKSYLPRGQREDVAAELEENLRSQMEEREENSGRNMTDAEVAEMLAGFGHPMEVAGRYLPCQYLIGPATFPAYWYALKALAMIFATLILVTTLTGLVRGDVSMALNSAGEMIWNLLAWTSLITLVFTALDRSDFRFFDRFDPQKLGDRIVRFHGNLPQPISRFESALDFLVAATVLLWWIGVFRVSAFPAWNIENWHIDIFALELSPGDTYPLFHYAVLGLLVLGLLRAARNFVRPYRTATVLLISIVKNIAWVALLLFAAERPDVITIAVAENTLNSAQWENMLPDIREFLANSIRILALIAAVSAIVDIVRVARSRPAQRG